jgi:branched-chain amino acid transport system ATP-binding protein
MTADPILRLDCISKKFGGVNVIDNLSFAVLRGSRTALIGPNGAGKTSVFNLISGVIPTDSGRIFFDGRDIINLASRARIRFGIARTFQNARLMHHLSALENVILGQHSRNPGWRGALQPVNLFANNRWREEARAGLADVDLSQYEDVAVGSLPYGVQRRIELVRACMARPMLLMLDEPAAGLNAAETEDLQIHLLKLCAVSNLTLLVVEHDMHFVGSLCDAAVVLSFGRKIAEGSPDAIRANPTVQEVYFGTSKALPAQSLAAARGESDYAIGRA